MSRRKQLGPVYADYPAKVVGEFLGDKLFKLVATVICCGLWTGLYYILIGVVNFNRKNFMENAREMSASELFRSEGSLWTLLGSYFIILIIVYRSRLGRKSVQKRKIYTRMPMRIWLTGALALTFAAAGCSSTPEDPAAEMARRTQKATEQYGRALDRGARDGKFEKIGDARLSFRPISPLQLSAGKAASVTFALKNIGGKPVRIPEWRLHEVDNVRLYCQPWLPGTEKPDPAQWFALDDDVRRPELRYPLELLPGNQVVVSKPLRFVESLVVSTGAERRYFLKAELNLTSLTLASDVFAIAVSNPQ